MAQHNRHCNPSMLGLTDNYDIFRCDRDRKGGGVMLIINRKLQPGKLCLPRCHIEAVAVQVHTPEIKNIMSIYRWPSQAITEFVSPLSNMLNNMCDIPVCVAGAFNENIICNPNNQITQLFDSAGFKQQVASATRDSGTLINHIYTHNCGADVTTQVKDCYYSDHDIILCSVAL